MQQQYHLTLKASYRPETLERILRVIRHRGFEVVTLHTEKQQEQLMLKISTRSERDISLLTAQLEKLIDVVELAVN